MSPARRILAGVAIGLLVVGCTSGLSDEARQEAIDLQQTLDELTREFDAVQTQLLDSEERVAELEQQVDRAQSHNREYLAERSQFEAEIESLTESRTQLEGRIAEYETLIAQLDPETREIRDSFLATLPELLCDDAYATATDPDAYLPSRQNWKNAVRDALRADPDLAAAFRAAGIDPTAQLDASEYADYYDACFDTGMAERDALLLAAALTSDKVSGTYRVGDEIATGRWQAEADIRDCYWERTNANGDIIANHFGSTGAGLTVTVQASDYSVTFSRCGVWTYLD